MAITVAIFHYALKLRSGGAVFDINQAVGQNGEVYMRIPPKGVGRVIFTFNGANREFDAICENENGIESFEKVSIVKAIDSNTLEVRALRSQQ